MSKDTHIFTVEGRGRFPFDMLRYDECWPYEVADANAMACDDRHQSDRRRIVLMTNVGGHPTVKRWESFNWKVIATRGAMRS